MRAVRAEPKNLFDATAAGATLSKTLWPGTYTVTLPSPGDGKVADLYSGSTVIGGVIAPSAGTTGLLLDFAAVGAADETLVIEIGKLPDGDGIAIPLASVSLKSMTTSGTVANVNPFTGAVTSSVTWRLFDLATITNKSQIGDVQVAVGGSEDNTPCQLILNTTQATFYYIVVTSLGALTRALCVVTPADALTPTTSGALSVTVSADTEFPAAAALADNTATPTTTSIGSFGMVYDGANWDFSRGTAADGTLVNLGTNNDVTVTGTVTVASHAVTNAGTFVVQVDGTALTRLTDIETNTDSGAVIGNGAAATAQRVTLANDSTGVIATVTTVTTVGAVTAITNALPAGTALLGKVGVDQTTPGTTNAVAVISGQAGIAGGTGVDGATVPRVTLATNVGLPAGTNAIGKLAANSGVDIGDVDVTSIAAGTNLIGKVYAKEGTDLIYDGTTALTPKFAIIDVATSGDNTLVAAVASRKIRVLSLWMVASAAVTVRFESGAAGTALSGQAQLAANGGFVLPYNPLGWFESASGVLLNLELSGAISVDGGLTYVEVP